MRKIVIFDGADGCGKTNMALELSKLTNIPYFKNVDEHKYFINNNSYFINAITYVDTYFTSYLESAKEASIILDRSWPSEWIYSKVFKRPTNDSILNSLDLRHSKLGTKIIIPFKTELKKIVDKYKIINDNINNLMTMSIEFSKWTKCDCLLLNTNDENLDKEMEEIINFINK